MQMNEDPARMPPLPPQNDICFPQVGAFFPGQPNACIAQNTRMLELQAGIDRTLAADLEPSGADAVASQNGAADEAGKASLDAYPGSSVAEKLNAAIHQNK